MSNDDPLQKALAILNRERHGDHDDWCLLPDGCVGQVDSGGSPIFTPFEARAVAAAYERRAGRRETER